MSVWTLKKLTELNVSSNPISSIPDSIGQLQELTKFAMYNIGAKILPNELWTLTKLESLFIGGNAYEGKLSSQISQLEKLYELNIEGCGLSVFPAEICKLPLLKRVGAKKNQFTSIPDCVKNMHLDWIGLDPIE